MHLVSRLPRVLAALILLVGLMAGLGVASANVDAPVPAGGEGHTAEQTPVTNPGSASGAPLPSPSPIQNTTPLSSATPSPDTPSPAASPSGTDSAPAKSAGKTDDEPSHTVRFDPADGSKHTQSTVKTGTLATAPQQNPQREGFKFDGWTLDGQPYDFRTPILQDTTLKAQWSRITDWTLSPDHGPAAGARLTISPPSPQEPYYTSIQAAGEQTITLTGDGRIHTWTQEGASRQVPFPAQAPDGFRWLQAAAGGRLQAALGSDQRIYAWDNGQSTPTILDANQDARFTGISMDGDLLLAVDRQGQVHAYQASRKDGQNTNPKFLEQATTGLPGQAQAVTAAASGGRALALDADGQAWAWDASKTGNVKPARIKQDTQIRIVQAQALNQGFLLLDADGQAWHQADGTTSLTAVELPENLKASRITTNNDQAVITSRDGRLWAWKPGEAPARADDGNQAYTQATAVGNRITATSRQGGMFTWSLDGQGRPGQPARPGTTAAPTLETAGTDGQPLKLSRTGDAWQTDIPARQPGPAAITITGRQDDQPFTRNLTYTVDQTLTRDNRQGSAYTVRFDTGGGNPTPQDQSIQPVYGRVQRPSPDPTRPGYLFDGWFTGQVAYDFSKPVTQNLTLTAHWTFKDPDSTWSISPDKGSQFGKETTTITPPDTSRGIRFNQVSASYFYHSLAVGSDGNAYAWGINVNGQLGDGTTTTRTMPVKVSKPAGTPADFTYVQVSAGQYHSLAVGSDGNAYAWGDNSYGRLGDGTTDPRPTPVKVSKPAGAPAGFAYVQVSAGCFHSLALGSDGNAYAWGNNQYGQLGNGTTTTQTITPVKVDKPADTPTDFTYLQVSAGDLHSLALGSDGNAYAWGSDANGQLGDGTTTITDTSMQTSPVKVGKPAGTPTDFTYLQVSAGNEYSLALGSDGNAYAWGYNKYGYLGDGTTTTRPTPVKVGKPAGTPADFTFLQVNAEYYHSLALGSDGNAYAWGWNMYGRLGDGTQTERHTPVKVGKPAGTPTDFTYLQVSAGCVHSLALGSDGNAYAWGNNGFSQLSNPDVKGYSVVPVPVVFKLVITGVRFDQTAATGLTRGDGSSVSVLTPEHLPGTVTVSVDYTLGGTPQQPDTSLRYTYLPAVLPRAGGEGILLALATGMTGMGGVLASRRHRREQHQLLHASHE
ncbi:RCC1 domain-containing protein [Bifidobacterium sp. ESL0825]|uniref:RCC1 domain-containing protein n=1 Tax=Bifidobacterium sp. ESL0825 TaxID=3448587 RepID=UPI004041ACC5